MTMILPCVRNLFLTRHPRELQRKIHMMSSGVVKTIVTWIMKSYLVNDGIRKSWRMKSSLDYILQWSSLSKSKNNQPWFWSLLKHRNFVTFNADLQVFRMLHSQLLPPVHCQDQNWPAPRSRRCLGWTPYCTGPNTQVFPEIMHLRGKLPVTVSPASLEKKIMIVEENSNHLLFKKDKALGPKSLGTWKKNMWDAFCNWSLVEDIVLQLDPAPAVVQQRSSINLAPGFGREKSPKTTSSKLLTPIPWWLATLACFPKSSVICEGLQKKTTCFVGGPKMLDIFS